MKTELCECARWARGNQSLITSHHPNCKKYNLEKDAKEVIEKLITGIDEWSSDEDGVHPKCWNAYLYAQLFVGLAYVERPKPPPETRPTGPPPPPIGARSGQSNNVTRQAKMHSLVAEMEAIRTRVAGMGAENAQRWTYDDIDFFQAETELKEIAVKLLEV